MKNLCPVEAFPPAYVYAITQIKHKKKALLEAAFAEVSNMTLYYKLTDSCYRANMPGKTNHLFWEIQISSRFCAPSGPMGLPPVVMPHPARILIISSICPWDNNVFFPRMKLFIIRIFA